MNALTAKTNTWTLKSGTNKGQRRIWIEGQRLAALGLTRGTLLSKHVVNDSLLLARVSADEFADRGVRGRCRVAGTLDRPILDLSGKWVTDFMGGAERFMIVTMVDESGNVEGLHIAPLR